MADQYTWDKAKQAGYKTDVVPITRQTIADGNLLNSDVIEAFSSRDKYLLDSLNATDTSARSMYNTIQSNSAKKWANSAISGFDKLKVNSSSEKQFDSYAKSVLSFYVSSGLTVKKDSANNSITISDAIDSYLAKARRLLPVKPHTSAMLYGCFGKVDNTNINSNVSSCDYNVMCFNTTILDATKDGISTFNTTKQTCGAGLHEGITMYNANAIWHGIAIGNSAVAIKGVAIGERNWAKEGGISINSVIDKNTFHAVGTDTDTQYAARSISINNAECDFSTTGAVNIFLNNTNSKLAGYTITMIGNDNLSSDESKAMSMILCNSCVNLVGGTYGLIACNTPAYIDDTPTEGHYATANINCHSNAILNRNLIITTTTPHYILTMLHSNRLGYASESVDILNSNLACNNMYRTVALLNSDSNSYDSSKHNFDSSFIDGNNFKQLAKQSVVNTDTAVLMLNEIDGIYDFDNNTYNKSVILLSDLKQDTKVYSSCIFHSKILGSHTAEFLFNYNDFVSTANVYDTDIVRNNICFNTDRLAANVKLYDNIIINAYLYGANNVNIWGNVLFDESNALNLRALYNLNSHDNVMFHDSICSGDRNIAMYNSSAYDVNSLVLWHSMVKDATNIKGLIGRQGGGIAAYDSLITGYAELPRIALWNSTVLTRDNVEDPIVFSFWNNKVVITRDGAINGVRIDHTHRMREGNFPVFDDTDFQTDTVYVI